MPRELKGSEQARKWNSKSNSEHVDVMFTDNVAALLTLSKLLPK